MSEVRSVYDAEWKGKNQQFPGLPLFAWLAIYGAAWYPTFLLTRLVVERLGPWSLAPWLLALGAVVGYGATVPHRVLRRTGDKAAMGRATRRYMIAVGALAFVFWVGICASAISG